MGTSCVVLTTKWWRRELFTDVMTLPDDLTEDGVRFFEVDDTNAASLSESARRFEALVSEFSQVDFPNIVTITDNAMYAFAYATRDLDFVRGASWPAFSVCSNKLATRRVVPRCDGLAFAAVRADQKTIPDIGVESLILKPSLGVSSIAVHKVQPGDPNPYYGVNDPCDMLSIDADSLPESLRPLFDSAEIGMVEEYVPPDAARKVSVDAFVFEGRMYPWAITDNVYRDDAPEKFDYLLCPTAALSAAEQGAVWSTMDELCAGLHADFGFDHQFICVELFVFDEHRVEVMEINPRISANQCPIFSRVLTQGDPIRAMIELQRGRCPDVPQPNGQYGVALYRARVQGRGAIERVGETVYYDRLDKAHVYCVRDEAEEVVEQARVFYARLAAVHHS